MIEFKQEIVYIEQLTLLFIHIYDSIYFFETDKGIELPINIDKLFRNMFNKNILDSILKLIYNGKLHISYLSELYLL